MNYTIEHNNVVLLRHKKDPCDGRVLLRLYKSCIFLMTCIWFHLRHTCIYQIHICVRLSIPFWTWKLPNKTTWPVRGFLFVLLNHVIWYKL